LDPPLIDREKGVVYFRCPPWVMCGECGVACGFNPQTPWYCEECREWMSAGYARWCKRRGHKVERL